VSSSSLQIKILRHETTPDEYHVYRAGLEWDLTDPIVIEKREDLKSEYCWHDLLEPYHHQVENLITFCRRLPVTLLADDVGLGKTISAGLIISELISRKRLSKILIVCPKLLGPQWQEELKTKFNIASSIAIGRNLITANPNETGAIITTYHSARLHLDSIPRDRFQMLILDEAHKLRNLYGVEKPPQVALRFRQALEDRRFRYVLMLTATPIQNRLWDLYSLVDLLTVARGHQNPFGSEGMFARKFIADNKEQARQLKPASREEFRSIVYSYMSRIRRGDARLYFPDRVVQMHKVEPTTAELDLIRTIATPIQNLNRLAQVSILQALTSSPDALMAQLSNMARKGTVPETLAATVCAIVTGMPLSAKLHGLGALIDGLKEQNPERWRLVVFTIRLETQTSIQAFLENRGLKVGIINGTSGPRNQETIARFRSNPPDFHIIVSTEAGSEGVNLQVANVLVNYDLPWNPMIVEQRIGRIQRLASEHASVGVFNIMLRGTFEEYIVGRLMEKLQMASHAIGDIESLLQASGINEEAEDGASSFDEKIRQLVIAALAGKDVEAATRLAEQSIANAKTELEREEESINAMLGGMDGIEYIGPRAPKLPKAVRSMSPHDFALAAFQSLGARITKQSKDLYLVEENGKHEQIRFDENNNNLRSTLYLPGTPAFVRLVSRIVATGVYDVDDLDENPFKASEEYARQWIGSFTGTFKGADIDEVRRCFDGSAIVRVRVTVAHDSYERLVTVNCLPTEHNKLTDQAGLRPLPRTIENPNEFGINLDKISEMAKNDEAISEFSRFYLERRAQEIQAAKDDDRKKKKLEDDFTPRFEMTLVAVEGRIHRRLKIKVRYIFDNESEYHNSLTITPCNGELADAPEMGYCEQSGKRVPKTCLKQCQISGKMVMQHFLSRSEVSSRLALPEFTVLCGLSAMRVLNDEAELSAVSGKLIANSLLKTSALSGKRAEANYFGQCAFTNAVVLNSELTISEISGNPYRMDEKLSSAISGRTGHKSEFIICYQTRQPILVAEAEQCEITGNYVKRGMLEQCALSYKRVLPSEIETCAVTGKRVLKKLLVTSSLSGARFLEDIALRSITGKYCTPVESKSCLWSGFKFHPDDLRICGLTGLTIHSEYIVTNKNKTCLHPLVDLLNGIKRTTDGHHLWDIIAIKTNELLGKRHCRVESAVFSPDKKHLAVCATVRSLLNWRTRHAGLVYSIDDNNIIGRLVQGRRVSDEWSE